MFLAKVSHDVSMLIFYWHLTNRPYQVLVLFWVTTNWIEREKCKCVIKQKPLRFAGMLHSQWKTCCTVYSN